MAGKMTDKARKAFIGGSKQSKKKPMGFQGRMTPRARYAYIGGSEQKSSTRPGRYIAAVTPGRGGGTLPGDKTGGKAIRPAFTGSGFNEKQRAAGRGKRGESSERPRLYTYKGSKRSPVTTGGVLRGAAKNPAAGRKGGVSAAAVAANKRRTVEKKK